MDSNDTLMVPHGKIAAFLSAFRNRFKVRDDFHEPDEQDVSVRVVGHVFDNAFGAYIHFPPREFQEMVVVLFQGGETVGQLNLASLLATAAAAGDLQVAAQKLIQQCGRGKADPEVIQEAKAALNRFE